MHIRTCSCTTKPQQSVHMLRMRVTTWTDIFVRVSGGETPPFRPPISPNDKTNDPQLIQLMRDCWDEYSTLRPDFSTIRSRFLVINKGKYDKVLISLKLINERYKMSSEQ